MERALLDQLLKAKSTRKPVAVVTWLSSGTQQLIERGQSVADSALSEAVNDGFRTDRSRTMEIGGEEVFINIHNPPLRLVLIGAVHIAQALIPMAAQLGYDPVVIDPRTAFASEERFAGVPRDARWPDEALPEVGLDTRTAFVALTHDPKIDDPALQIAMTSEVFYIGALGSKRTHAKRVDRLTEAGLSAEQIARINAPIGLDIGAVGPNEIAISIMAEVTAELRGKLTATA
ncbi:MAG: XdhC family protein [Hyphomicrobiaceae bacterium TMED74]|nr:XdhC/CoxF family protein [Filomicrobium sp.]RPG46880.1 MAG: XdhC family protein [Hyphomicrobiaceae bacterium TMED74]